MPRNLSFCFNRIKSPPSPEHPPLNTSRPSPFPFKNFNSLYDPSTAAEDSDPDDIHSSAAPPEHLAAAFASRRFFCSSPGRSNSIVDSTTSSFASTSLSSAATSASAQSDAAVSAVPKYSPDPYVDFRRSMKEMVGAREVHDGRESWDYLHELLVCYLSLNPKSTHKFIIAAFADVVVGMMTSPSPEEGSPGNDRRAEDFPAVDLCINY